MLARAGSSSQASRRKASSFARSAGDAEVPVVATTCSINRSSTSRGWSRPARSSATSCWVGLAAPTSPAAPAGVPAAVFSNVCRNAPSGAPVPCVAGASVDGGLGPDGGLIGSLIAEIAPRSLRGHHEKSTPKRRLRRKSLMFESVAAGRQRRQLRRPGPGTGRANRRASADVVDRSLGGLVSRLEHVR